MLPQFCQHFGKDVPVFGCISTDLLASRYSFRNMYFKIQVYIEAFNTGFTHNLANFRKLPICLKYHIEKLLKVETFRTSLHFLADKLAIVDVGAGAEIRVQCENVEKPTSDTRIFTCCRS
jgi:hypothetical protein